MANSEKKTKQKRPTAEKRMLQNVKRRERNKSLKSSIRTTIRKLEESIKARDEAKIQDALKDVYSQVDKAVKHGIFKLNKASRIKSRLTAKAAQVK